MLNNPQSEKIFITLLAKLGIDIYLCINERKDKTCI